MYLSEETDVCCLDHFEATKFNLSFHSGSSSDPVGPGPSTSQPSTSQPKPDGQQNMAKREGTSLKHPSGLSSMSLSRGGGCQNSWPRKSKQWKWQANVMSS